MMPSPHRRSKDTMPIVPSIGTIGVDWTLLSRIYGAHRWLLWQSAHKAVMA